RPPANFCDPCRGRRCLSFVETKSGRRQFGVNPEFLPAQPRLPIVGSDSYCVSGSETKNYCDFARMMDLSRSKVGRNETRVNGTHKSDVTYVSCSSFRPRLPDRRQVKPMRNSAKRSQTGCFFTTSLNVKSTRFARSFDRIRSLPS
ncbi:MAG: hypothetical protein JWM11_1191, partial [Planctomycetaceae bacterium]|nr:hypothetical protein [Planctomycetaceae bacterium]